MKILTCKEMGGTCDAKISGNSEDEVMTNGMKHMEDAHPEMAEDIKKMPEDDPLMVDWLKNYKKTYADAPEVAEEK